MTASPARSWSASVPHAATVGAFVWVLLVLGDAAGLRALGLVALLLALGPLVVVPLGLPLAVPGPRPTLPRRSGRVHPGTLADVAATVQPAGAAAATAALLAPRGIAAASLAAGWCVACGLVAAAAAQRSWQDRRSPVTGPLTRFAAGTYLLVAGVWLVVDRAGARPLGLPAMIVELTAVHFHYAGFAAALVAGAAATAARGRLRRVARPAALAVVAGPAVVAAGFTLHGWLQIAGAALLAAGLVGVAVVTVLLARAVAPDRITASLLVVSSAAVVVPMLLAVQWAVGHNLGTPALSIPDMARYHGTANAFGFALCGLLGWRRAGQAPLSR